MKNFYISLLNILQAKSKIIAFVAIFFLFCFFYNLNNQTLNFVLKRGLVLEYSINKNTKINKEQIEKELIKNNVKFSSIEQVEMIYPEFDKYENKIDNILYIALPFMIDNESSGLINKISSFVFDNYKNAKLLDVKTLNESYSKPYNAFLKFFHVFILTLFLWFFIFLIIDKNFVENLRSSFNNFLNDEENDFNIKEKGIAYFIKRILFDIEKDENGNEIEPNIAKEIINTIVFVLISVILIRFFIGELRWIPSGSMRPTILEKDRVFVEKLDFPKREIKRGDILVFYPPEAELSNSPLAIFARLSGIFCKDIAFIKRVVGMPNDKFEIKYNQGIDEYRVYINDIPLDEPYIISKNKWTPCDEKMYCGPFVIPENNYFMMGDNRGNSQDSRFWGFLPKDRIIGRATFMFWPFARINKLKDKYVTLYEKKENGKLKEELYLLNRY